MQGNNSKSNPSLLRVFLLSMAGIAVLFSLMSLGIWVFTTEVLQRERQLINELLPELDAAHQLTATTAGLQSQGFLLRSSQTANELNWRRNRLDMTISEIVDTLDNMASIKSEVHVNLRKSVDDLTGVAISLAELRAQQIDRQRQIADAMPERLALLSNLEKKIELRVVDLTEQLLDISESMAELDAASHIDSLGQDLFNRQLQEYEALSLSIQDHLLFNQDVVSLSALLEKVPLLNEQQNVVLALQNRDLIFSALTSRSIYMSGADQSDGLLTSLRDLHAQTIGKQSLFRLQEEVLAQESAQDTLHTLLRERTEVILEKTNKLRIDSRSSVRGLVEKTLNGLDKSRVLPVILSVFAFFLLGMVSYWLLYRKTVLPLITITKQFDDVGTSRFPKVAPDYYLKELSALSSAMSQLDAAQRNMLTQDQELQKINLDLQHANEELQQFAHIASHDLQEPLRKLQQFSEILVEDYGTDLDEDGKFFIETIHSSALRMSVLIKETLAYSRSGSSNQKLARVDLSQLLKKLREELDVAILEADGEFIIEHLPVVLANELGMAQLFRNLMVNGLKYRKPGTPARVQISLDHESEASAFIRVEDNGIGIPGKHLQRIFVPFERLHDSAIPGTGLGLAICKKVCESHGWSIDVSSELDVGTAFVIRIPRASIKS